MLKIKRDDEDGYPAGKDKGKRGKVRKVLDNNKLIVSGINMVKNTQAQPQAGVAGGIVEKEAPIQVSNVGFSTPRPARLIVWVLRWKETTSTASSNPVARQLTLKPVG